MAILATHMRASSLHVIVVAIYSGTKRWCHGLEGVIVWVMVMRMLWHAMCETRLRLQDMRGNGGTLMRFR